MSGPANDDLPLPPLRLSDRTMALAGWLMVKVREAERQNLEILADEPSFPDWGPGRVLTVEEAERLRAGLERLACDLRDREL
jgi:hypothetical protein